MFTFMSLGKLAYAEQSGLGSVAQTGVLKRPVGVLHQKVPGWRKNFKWLELRNLLEFFTNLVPFAAELQKAVTQNLRLCKGVCSPNRCSQKARWSSAPKGTRLEKKFQVVGTSEPIGIFHKPGTVCCGTSKGSDSKSGWGPRPSTF